MTSGQSCSSRRDHLLENEIRVAAGEEQQVHAGDMERIAFARLVRKGRHPRGFTHGPQAGYSVRTPLWVDASLCHGIFAGYSMDFRFLTAALDFDACRSTFDNRILSANADDFGVDARISYAWAWRWLTLQLGMSVGASWLRQTFTTRGLSPDRNSIAGRLAALCGVEARLPWGLYAVATVAGQTCVLKQQAGNDAGDTGNAARFVARTSVGLGKRF